MGRRWRNGSIEHGDPAPRRLLSPPDGPSEMPVIRTRRRHKDAARTHFPGLSRSLVVDRCAGKQSYSAVISTTASGAGGNRTPVRRVVAARDTTVPEVPVCGYRSAGSDGPVTGTARQVFPWCQPSFRLSAVSPCGPPLLLLTGCSGQAPCAIAGHDSSLFATWIRRRERTAHQCWQLCCYPCLRSLRQLRSHESASGPNVETDQPRVLVVCPVVLVSLACLACPLVAFWAWRAARLGLVLAGPM